MKGFAFPRQFRAASLAESLSRNNRELVSFLNSYVVRFESDASTLLLPGDVTVAGATTLEGLDVNGDATFPAGSIDDVNGLLFSGLGASMSRRTSDQSISATTTTVVDWNTEDYDSHGSIADIANNRFEVPTGCGGLWLVTAHVTWAGTAPNQADLRVGVNGSDGRYLVRGDGTSTFKGVTGSTVLDLSAGDQVDVRVYYSTASIVRSDAGGNFSHASFVKIA